MLKKTASVVMSLVLASALLMTSFDSAEARRGRRGAAIVGGLALGLLALGAADAYGHRYHRRGCWRGPRECRWVGGECWWNRYGERVCSGGYRECRRPTYCD